LLTFEKRDTGEVVTCGETKDIRSREEGWKELARFPRGEEKKKWTKLASFSNKTRRFTFPKVIHITFLNNPKHLLFIDMRGEYKQPQNINLSLFKCGI